jgi:predicted DNA-binding transcriptional regulator AlpA
MAYVGVRDTQFDEIVKNDPTFPKPVKVSDVGRTVIWIRAELDAWLELRKQKRDADLKKKQQSLLG